MLYADLATNAQLASGNDFAGRATANRRRLATGRRDGYADLSQTSSWIRQISDTAGACLNSGEPSYI